MTLASTLPGLLWARVFLRETSGKSLEAMDAMFSLPWYVIGRRGAELTQGMGINAGARAVAQQVIV
jgi:hypothetical protein